MKRAAVILALICPRRICYCWMMKFRGAQTAVTHSNHLDLCFLRFETTSTASADRCTGAYSNSMSVPITRREAWELVLSMIPLSSVLYPPSAMASHLSSSKQLPKNLTYQSILGAGSFKQVYKVETGEVSMALSVERLRSRRQSIDEVSSIELLEELSEDEYLETIHCWWIQTCPPIDFVEGGLVMNTKCIVDKTSISSNSAKSYWLLALKPLYDVDLKSFMEKAPLQSQFQNHLSIMGVPLNDFGALQMAIDMMHIGSILSQKGIVHRDIKPKNLMLRQGRVVLIDFGFAQRVDDRKRDFCVVEPGRIVGEVDYIWPDDASKYKGCHRGDQYAMGKSLWEVVFLSSTSATVKNPGANEYSAHVTISATNAAQRQRYFWERLEQTENAVSPDTRFKLSDKTKNQLVKIIRGLCEASLSFEEAEKCLLDLSSAM